MANVYKFVRNDTLPPISLTLTRDDGDAADLTNGVVYFHIRAKGSPTVALTKVATITDATGGACAIIWDDGDLELAAGMYEAEIEVVIDQNRETVYDTVAIQIREDIA